MLLLKTRNQLLRKYKKKVVKSNRKKKGQKEEKSQENLNIKQTQNYSEKGVKEQEKSQENMNDKENILKKLSMVRKRKIPDLQPEFTEEFLNKILPNFAPKSDPLGLYEKCRSSIHLGFSKSKEFFTLLYTHPDYEYVKNEAYFYLCWSENFFYLGKYDGAYQAVKVAVSKHFEPYEIIGFYLHDFVPRRCADFHKKLSMKCSQNMEVSNIVTPIHRQEVFPCFRTPQVRANDMDINDDDFFTPPYDMFLNMSIEKESKPDEVIKSSYTEDKKNRDKV